MSLRKLIPGSLPSLLTLFGITPQGREDISFVLNGEVVPVAICGSTVSLTATSTEPRLDTPFTGGEMVNPALNAVLADSGQQNAGNYTVLMFAGSDFSTTGALTMRLRRRNAADTADIWSQYFVIGGSGTNHAFLKFRVALAQNERIRINNAIAATLTAQVNIWLVPDGS
jgi:hypothetical protein